MKIIKIAALILLIAFFGSIIVQFGYNMLFVQPFAAESTIGDGKLTEMLYQSEFLEDSYFDDVALVSSILSFAIATCSSPFLPSAKIASGH